jgi:hypothetical protein
MDQHVFLQLVLSSVHFATGFTRGGGIDVHVTHVRKQCVLHPEKMKTVKRGNATVSNEEIVYVYMSANGTSSITKILPFYYA